MAILALKLTLTPIVIVAVTLAARRFGPSIGGWLIGLPVTAGPVVAFLAVEHGSHFAERVVLGLVAAVAAQTAFCVGYAFAAGRGAGWPLALAAGTAAFFGVGLALVLPGLGLAESALASLVALAIGLAYLPKTRVDLVARPPRYDLLVRVILATGLLLLITGFALTLGPGLSGLVTAYPLLSSLVAVFAHRSDGPRAAIAVYRGLVIGLFALMGFTCTLALVLTRVPLADAYTLAIALTLAIQFGSLRVMRA